MYNPIITMQKQGDEFKASLENTTRTHIKTKIAKCLGRKMQTLSRKARQPEF